MDKRFYIFILIMMITISIFGKEGLVVYIDNFVNDSSVELNKEELLSMSYTNNITFYDNEEYVSIVKDEYSLFKDSDYFTYNIGKILNLDYIYDIYISDTNDRKTYVSITIFDTSKLENKHINFLLMRKSDVIVFIHENIENAGSIENQFNGFEVLNITKRSRNLQFSLTDETKNTYDKYTYTRKLFYPGIAVGGIGIVGLIFSSIPAYYNSEASKELDILTKEIKENKNEDVVEPYIIKQDEVMNSANAFYVTIGISAAFVITGTLFMTIPIYNTKLIISSDIDSVTIGMNLKL